MINDIRWTLRFRKGQYERKWCRSIPWHFYNKVYVMFYLLVSVMVWIYSSMELRVSPAAARISHIQFTASTALLIAMGITTVMLSRNGASAEPPEAPGSTIDQKTPAMVPEPSPLGSTVLNLPPPTHDRGEVLAYAYFGVHLVINTAFLWVICTGLNPNSLGLIGVYITSSIILPWICLTLFYQTKIARIWPLLAVTLISSNGSYGLIATTASSYSPNRISKISVYTVGTRPVVRSSDPISNNEPDSPRPFESLQSFDEPGPLAPRVGTQRDRNYLEEIAMVTERTLTDSNTIVRRKILFQSIFFSLLVVGLYGLRYAKEYSERMAFLSHVQTERRLTVLHQAVIRLTPVRGGDGANIHGESTLEEMLSLLKQARNLLTVANTRVQSAETVQVIDIIKEVVRTMSIGGDLFKVRFANLGEEEENIIDQYVRGGSHATTAHHLPSNYHTKRLRRPPLSSSGTVGAVVSGVPINRNLPTADLPRIVDDPSQLVEPPQRANNATGGGSVGAGGVSSSHGELQPTISYGGYVRKHQASSNNRSAAGPRTDELSGQAVVEKYSAFDRKRNIDTKQARQAVMSTKRMRNTNVLFDCYMQPSVQASTPDGSYANVSPSTPPSFKNIAFSEMDERVGLDWSLDIFRFTESKPDVLVQFGAAMLVHYCGFLGITADELLGFLGALQECYWDNAYHNRIHAAFVAHASACFSNMLGLTSGPAYTELTEVVCVTASLGHDVGHPSRTNQFFINTYDPLAVIYNDVSVLENYHAFLTFQILDNGPCDIFGQLTVTIYREARRRIIEIILATDMKEHFEAISKFRIRRCAPDFVYKENPDDLWHCLKIVVKAADLSHGCVEWSQHFLWSCLIQEEFYQQGEEEKSLGQPISPLCDRDSHHTFAKSQKGFLEFVVAPLYTELREIDPSSAVSVCLENLWTNKEHWTQIEACGEYVVFPEFVKRYQEKRRAELRAGGGLKAMFLYVNRLANEHARVEGTGLGDQSNSPSSRMLSEAEDADAPHSLDPIDRRRSTSRHQQLDSESDPPPFRDHADVKIRAVRWA